MADTQAPGEEGRDRQLVELRRQVRDLAALLALPAMWRTFDPARTVSSLVEVVGGLLRPTCVYALVADDDPALTIEDHYPRGMPDALRLRLAAAANGSMPRAEGLVQIDDPAGTAPLRVWIARPRGQRQRWSVLAGSRRTDFPTPIERFLLEGAADQAAVSVEKTLLIAAERRARDEAEAANAAKSSFLASMSHELRTPLNAISGYVDLMQLGIRGPITEQQREDLGRVRRSAQHLLGLINDVLNFAKIEAGHIEISAEHISLCELLTSLQEWVDPQLRERDHVFTCELPAPDVVVFADPERLHQILLNLLSNAIKFTAPHGSIAVWCTPGPTDVAIHVKDTGRGIPADKLARIFEPFVQVDQALARGTNGVGLGLTISRDLARSMGGDLLVESVEHQGSRFTVVLPRSTPQSVADRRLTS